jgi:Ca-activated chloride channel family protein
MVMTPLLIACAALASSFLAEWLHRRRLQRVARLAFGPTGAPARWAAAAPALRCACVAATAWGATTLALYDPVHVDEKPAKQASKQLLICMDVSPSMMLKDAGPAAEKVTRAAWAGKVVHGILDRLDTDTTRVTLFAFYTDALPVVQETFDKEVVRNALDGLPMYVAFEPGATDMHKGVTKSLEFARVWPRKSAMLVVISDGDASANTAPLHVPDSIADTIVIGVGDPFRSSVINGHGSRQDADSLKQLAARLGGIYHNGNEKHLPSEVLDKLAVTSPRTPLGIGLREAALVAVGCGAALLALLEPGLILFGRPRTFRRDRAQVSRRARTDASAASVPSAGARILTRPHERPLEVAP